MTKLRVKETIKERGLTSAEVSKKMGISPAAFSLAINGNPTIDKLTEIAEAIGCRVSDLLDEDGSNTVKCPYCGKPIIINAEVI